jgi:Kef-type K+ transport system membrane component KefB/nucleotide-binding universal stress UspA family protein
MTGSSPARDAGWRTRAFPQQRCLATTGLLAIATLTWPVAAVAAEGMSGPSATLFLAQFIALLVLGRLLGELMVRIGQPEVMGQLLAGIVLGPSVFGSLWPDAQHAMFPSGAAQKGMIEAVGQVGVLMLLLLTGLETDLSVVRKIKRPAISASFFGISIPFAIGFALGEFLPVELLPNPESRLITALFCGIALSISSVKIVAMVVRSLGFTHRRVGQVLLAAAILDDTVGWIILSAILGLARRGHVDGQAVMQTMASTVVFLLVSFTLGRRIVSLLIRLANDYLLSEMAVITVILVVMGLFALATDALGVHTVLGAFVAGMVIAYSPILTQHIEVQLRGLTVALFMPVFFGLAGLSADLSILKQPALLGWAAAFIAAASVGKFTGAFIGGRLGALTTRESFALGCGMNARGSTEVILASLGLALGALSTTLYTLIVTMALVTTLVMPPMLRFSLRRIPINSDETRRLERLEFEGRGYVPNLERLLIAVDQSPSGKLASRFAKLLATSWGMPSTVVPLGRKHGTVVVEPPVEPVATEPNGKPKDLANDDADKHLGPTRASAHASKTQTTIAEVSKKGFDLLWIGTEPGVDDSGVILVDVSDIASAFHGHFALVVARGELAEDSVRTQPRILVPVTGTAHSRRAAELALALAQACRASVTALHVAAAPPQQIWRQTLSLKLAMQREEEAVLREIAALAHEYGTYLRPRARTARAPAEAILEELDRGIYSFVVLGVTQRSTGMLSLGTTARTVLARSPQSVLLHAS